MISFFLHFAPPNLCKHTVILHQFLKRFFLNFTVGRPGIIGNHPFSGNSVPQFFKNYKQNVQYVWCVSQSSFLIISFFVSNLRLANTITVERYAVANPNEIQLIINKIVEIILVPRWNRQFIAGRSLNFIRLSETEKTL